MTGRLAALEIVNFILKAKHFSYDQCHKVTGRQLLPLIHTKIAKIAKTIASFPTFLKAKNHQSLGTRQFK